VKGICAVLLGDDPRTLQRDLQDRFPDSTLVDSSAKLEAVVSEMVKCVESPARSMNVTFDIRGTEFQKRVWQILREIPAGRTASYTDIANQLGRPKAVRAVAQACAANTLAVVIPCHRVIKSNGEMSGYRWGVERKRALLQREAAACVQS
jgi:AraC family transcriptional regulator of adaptative response/methylated-DNA-[protein]-cysteine methyltransferase